MNVEVLTAALPKPGYDAGQYEDAYFAAIGIGRERRCLRLAVADGATESAFSGHWAQQLVSAWGMGRLDLLDPVQELLQMGSQWRGFVRSRPLPWYLEAKTAEGAHAAFVGLSLSRGRSGPSSGTWQAGGMGDCCLLHIRGDRLLRALPLSTSGEFGSRPVLVPTDPMGLEPAVAYGWWRMTGTWEKGDMLLMMTDAIACWFLRQAESGGRRWSRLCHSCNTTSMDAIRRWLPRLQGAKAVRGDDLTMVVARML